MGEQVATRRGPAGRAGRVWGGGGRAEYTEKAASECDGGRGKTPILGEISYGSPAHPGDLDSCSRFIEY